MTSPAAAAAGLYVMPYVFANPYESNASNPNAGTAGARSRPTDGWKVIGAVTTPAYKSSDLMLPVVVDLETDPYVNTETNSNQCYGLSQSTMVAWITAFINEMKKDSGKTPIIYTTTWLVGLLHRRQLRVQGRPAVDRLVRRVRPVDPLGLEQPDVLAVLGERRGPRDRRRRRP